MNTAIILAGGTGQRMHQEIPKQFINVNDKTVEGLLYLNEPIKTVQFHPEANAGPKDSELLFDEFMKMMSK